MRDGGEGSGGVCRRFGLDVIPSYAEKCDALRRVLVDGRAARARVVEANLRLVVVEGVVHAAPSEPNVSALGTRGKKRMSGRNARKSEKYSFPCKNVAREHLSLSGASMKASQQGETNNAK